MKTRNITIVALRSESEELKRDYSTSPEVEQSDELIEITLEVEDTAETYKRLSRDPRVSDWFFDRDIPVGDPRGIEDLLLKFDLKDMKTVIGICSEVFKLYLFYTRTPADINAVDLIKWAIERFNPWNPKEKEEEDLSETTIKNVLRAMATGPSVFSEGLRKSLVKTISKLQGTWKIITFEGFCREVFSVNYE